MGPGHSQLNPLRSRASAAVATSVIWNPRAHRVGGCVSLALNNWMIGASGERSVTSALVSSAPGQASTFSPREEMNAIDRSRSETKSVNSSNCR